MDTSLVEESRKATASLSSDSFFFMSPYHSFTTRGCFARLDTPAADGEARHGAFQTALRDAFDRARRSGIARPIVVGAIPFDTRQPSALFVPESRSDFTPAGYTLPERAAAAPRVKSREAIPEQDAFMAMVARAAALTDTPAVRKIVLSRLIDITTEETPDSLALLARLVAQNPASFNFHVPLPDGGTLLGASPELLLRKDGNTFSSLPLAGSARRHADAAQDKAAGQTLLCSAKDRHEHELVTQAMRDVLAPRSQHLAMPGAPELITTPTLWHLATPVEGEARFADDNALSLACLLHPTPALSGFPHEAAKAYIAELEPFERELFGGIVGWCDAEGNGEWVVTIRCARLRGNQVRLFAGAGIVPASDPLSEWRETGTKLSTMLHVLGLH
ncbi:isochorismate synthase EntC [Cronobacter muytjensii]